MRVIETGLEGLKIVQLNVFGDARGFFVERFHKDKFNNIGLPSEFPQDNHSRSGGGVLRGLHYQYNPAQGKLVGVTRGSIWDVAVDIRPTSKTYGKSFGMELNDRDGKLLWIPAGFAHGFCTLGDDLTDVYYKVTAVYTPATESGIAWNDPELNIPWPVQNPTVSERDTQLQSFAEYRKNPAVFV